MRRWYLVVGAFLACPLSPVMAQDRACANPTTTLDERRCLAAQAERATKTMTATVDSIGKTLDDSARAALMLATHQWTLYRSSECDAVLKSYSGGSMGLIENLNCMIALTHQRRRQLLLWYRPAEGP